jgi:phenylpropionate dioxygenase-like ring-hydroxylating dioxygenase large terminal subunit
MQLPIRTGPGTPGGDLLRRYWQPVALSHHLLHNAPQAVRILGEDLVLFRGEDGRPGLLGIKCAHRRADLSYGRVEDGGLRCVYHGWLFDRGGRCLQQPGEPEGGRNRDRIRQPAYPCVERGGAVWAYMGPGEPPLFPGYPALTVPDELRFTFRWHSNCNYLQANEGNVDPVHTSYLHHFDPGPARGLDALRTGLTQDVFGVDTAPTLEVRETRFGLRVFTERRLAAPGKKLLRVTNFVMPNACAIGGAETPFGRGGASMFWHVPIDDTSHYRYEFTFHSKVRLPKEEMERAYRAELDADGMPRRQAHNRYLQRREDMDSSYLGMGIVFPAHDLFITESQGAILDRSEEHLVSSDVAIVRARRMLSEALSAVAAGRDPCGVLREPSQNAFRDLLVLSETIDTRTDPDKFCAALEAEEIYAVDAAALGAGEPELSGS